MEENNSREITENKIDETDKHLLDEAYKNVRMASFAIDCLIEKIENEKLERLLRKQNKHYLGSVTKIENLAEKIGHKLKDINPILKGTSFVSIKMKTLVNNDSQKFAEMLIEGTTMGITDTLKAKSDYPSKNDEILSLVDDIISYEEEFVDSLKTFL